MDADTSLRQIRITRYCLTYENQYLEIDIYPFWSDQAILEIELRSENEALHIPKFLRIINEVTGDEAYRNYSLAKRIYHGDGLCFPAFLFDDTIDIVK